MPEAWPCASRVLLAALLIFVAGCGSSSTEPRTQPARTAPVPGPTPTQPPPTPPNFPLNEPFGKLLPGEKRSIVREYRALESLDEKDGEHSEIERGRRVCAALTSPQTTLIALVRMDCDNAIGFLGAVLGLAHAAKGCNAPTPADRMWCLRDAYGRIEQASGQAVLYGRRVNDELYRRGIPGLCSRSIGLTKPQIAGLKQAEKASNAASNAIAVSDVAGIRRASDELSRARRKINSNDALPDILRGCPTSKRTRPRAPAKSGTNP